MTAFDLAVVAIVALSALFALMRGLVREVIALATWIAALVVAFAFAAPLAASLDGARAHPVAWQVAAFIALFVGVMILGGIIARLLSGVVRAIGLGWLDRLLGGAFGIARGLAIVLIGILLAGLTTLPNAPWWQNSSLAAPLTAAAMEFRDWLPPDWAQRLDFPRDRPPSRGGGTRVARPLPQET